MVLNVSAMLTRLEDQATSDRVFLEQCLDDYPEVAEHQDNIPDSSCPILDRVSNDSGEEGVRVMTNFTRREFDVLWGVAELPLKARWNDGRGSKSKTTPMDALFMTLTVLKHYDSWEKHALDFGFKAPTFQKLILRVVEVVMPVFYTEFVKMPKMSELRAQDHTFANYPYALYATDVKFQPTERPAGRHGEAKPYFSAKHKLYGLKIPESVRLPPRPSRRHERSPPSQHVASLAKSDNELNILDHGEQVDTYRGMWALLVDKGYYGASAEVRAIHPKKNPPRGALDPEDIVRNRRVSSDRVVVENFFGRVCSLWKVSYATFTWSTKFYDDIQRLTFALTNFHVSLLPLRETDRHWYRSVLARYESMVHTTAAKRAESQRKSRLRRMQRIAMSRGRNPSYVFTTP
ncbi:hypothetical protein AaE_012427 [Aphanomyces astaci]|uniref:DDE Tnp4 domain-containing protein n=1 Tax=Aphanomyces astaci TaxID=112090 RepID=A0A6A4ZNB3_APHAT|nr:hypothetical protein AaE_012427 [Aphanomyces astaci]